MCISHDDQKIAYESSEYTINIYDLNLYKDIFTLRGHTHYVQSIEFSRDDTMLVSGGNDKIIKIWDTATGFLIRNIINDLAKIISISFSPNNRIIASLNRRNEVAIWDIDTGLLIWTIIMNDECSTVSYSPSGEIILLSSSKYITIIDAKNYEIIRKISHGLKHMRSAFCTKSNFHLRNRIKSFFR